MSILRVEGECDPRFERVRSLLERNVESKSEIGASLCVWHKGRKVIDLWGGLADKKKKTPWSHDSVGVIFSSTKGLAALCAMILADRGQLDYDAPVSQYWPGFGAEGKGEITVRTLLNHRSGLVGISQPVSLDDFETPDGLRPKLEAQAPLWKPDTHQGYHGVTFGMYAGELIRQISGRTVGEILAEEVAGPLGVDAFIGTPEHVEPRVARLYKTDLKTALTKVIPRAVTGLTLEGKIYRAALKRGSHTHSAFAQPAELGIKGIQNFDTPRVRRMELPWANGVANARSLATIYAALIGADGRGGERLVKRSTWGEVTRRQSWQKKDAVLLKPLGWSQGFLKEETRLFSPNPESFGHPGAGGALGWADPVADLSIGYVMNRMDFHLRSRRALALCHEIYKCL